MDRYSLIIAVTAASLASSCSAQASGLEQIGAVPTPQMVSSSKPHVISTLPAAGETIVPGEFVLSVTFDRPMRAQSFSYVKSDEGAFPVCQGMPALSADASTFSVRCHAVANKQYVIWLNNPSNRNFKSAETGEPATPFQLHFRTLPR
jgi:hypothetical protein